MLLLESEARFRQIVENASDIIYRTDVQGRCTYINPIGLRLMNFKDETEVIGKHYLDLATPAARHELKRFYARQFLSRQEATYFEFPAVTRDGREIWLGQNVQLITEGERIIGFQAVARDISAIKKAQEAMAISRDQALEASHLKGQLLSRVSHELRTPLGAILGFSELLHMNAFGVLSDGQKDAVNQIMDSTNYLTQIVNELLDEAQIESKSMTLKMDFFPPASMLEKVESSMAVLARNKGLAFSTKVAPGVPDAIYGDERRLQQVLINLVGNAIKFMGISEEAQSYIFDPFRQVDNAITRKNRGTGLGLSITKQLVELMDGEIKLKSEVGQGSTFTVTLPILKKQEHHK
jgi:PAS domain S-box-containing protein